MVEFLDDAEIIQLSDDVVDSTILLKKAIKIKTPDAIIAATALVDGLVIITNNITDFKRVKGLKVSNPYEL
jgi:predicted nucleic acid-binding protein